MRYDLCEMHIYIYTLSILYVPCQSTLFSSLRRERAALHIDRIASHEHSEAAAVPQTSNKSGRFISLKDGSCDLGDAGDRLSRFSPTPKVSTHIAVSMYSSTAPRAWSTTARWIEPGDNIQTVTLPWAGDMYKFAVGARMRLDIRIPGAVECWGSDVRFFATLAAQRVGFA